MTYLQKKTARQCKKRGAALKVKLMLNKVPPYLDPHSLSFDVVAIQVGNSSVGFFHVLHMLHKRKVMMNYLPLFNPSQQ